MPLALPHTALLRPQREHMAWPSQHVSGDCQVSQRVARQTAIVRADPRRRGRVIRIYRHGICGASGILAVRDHRREVQLVSEGGEDRRADVARGVADHESHLLGRHICRRDDQVAFILAREVVQDDDEFAIS